MELRGALLLQVVAERIIARHLRDEGMSEVSAVTLDRRNGHGDGVDLIYSRLGRPTRVKVKADPYFGVDPLKSGDFDLPYYRLDRGEYALEAVAHLVTRQPGWVFRSDADQLFYHLLALEHTEEQVADLVRMPDEEFFAGLRVARDELRILPMDAVKAWFARRQEDVASCLVEIGDHSAQYGVIPRVRLDRAVPTIVNVGPIYRP